MKRKGKIKCSEVVETEEQKQKQVLMDKQEWERREFGPKMS